MSTEFSPAHRAFDTAISTASTGEAVFGALANLAQAIVGAKLFTVMIVDMKAGLQRRAYTTDLVAYPVSGTKPLVRNHWFAIVNDARQPFVGNTIEELAAVFPDYQTIDALGCQSVVNLPVFLGGQLAGTINLLDVAGHYTPDRVTLIEKELSIPAKLCFALHDRLQAV